MVCPRVNGGTFAWVRSSITSRRTRTPELDTSRILVLRQSLGDQRCREVVEEVVFHLTDRLGLLQAALDAGNAAEAQVLASRLASLSEQVGLADFARVARDLGACLAAGDRDRDRRGRRPPAPARRGFAVLGDPLRRSIGLVAFAERRAARRCRAMHWSSPMPLSPAPDPRAIPLHVRRRRRALPGWLERQDAATRAWVGGDGLRGRARRGALPARRPTAALRARARRLGHARGAGARPLPPRRRRRRSCRPGATRSPPRGVALDPGLEALGWLLAGYRFDRYRERQGRRRPSSSVPTASTPPGSTAIAAAAALRPGPDQHARPATWGRRRSRRPSSRSARAHGARGAR